MKKKILFGIFLLFLMIPFVKAAEEKTYEVCKQGCTYDNLNDVLNDIWTLDRTKTYDFLIDIKDAETYTINESSIFNRTFSSSSNIVKSNLVMKGSNGKPTIKRDDGSYIIIIDVDHMTIENIKFSDAERTSFDASTLNAESDIKIKNCDFDTKYVTINFRDTEFDNVNIDSEQLAFYYISKNVLIKDSTIKVVGEDVDHQGLRSDSLGTIIENSTVTASIVRPTDYSGVFEITGSTINSPIEMRPANNLIASTTVNGNITMYGNFELNNATINTDKENGLTIIGGQGDIVNSKISGATKFAVKYITDDFTKGYLLNIYNSDLSNNAASLLMKAGEICPITAEYPCDYYATLVEPEKHTKYGETINAWFIKSKIKAIQAEDKSVAYVDRTNTLTSKAKRANSLTKGNIVELTKGKVLLEQSNTGVIRINVDKDVNLNKYFEDLGGQVLGDWMVEDTTILRIENGRIIPLKVGTTTVTAFVNNTYYVLGITVTEDMLPNPETKDTLIVLAGLILLISGGLAIYQYQKINAKKRLN